jgi:hypothetical protein
MNRMKTTRWLAPLTAWRGIPLLTVGVALLGPGHPLIRPLIERLNRWRSEEGQGVRRENIHDART